MAVEDEPSDGCMVENDSLVDEDGMVIEDVNSDDSDDVDDEVAGNHKDGAFGGPPVSVVVVAGEYGKADVYGDPSLTNITSSQRRTPPTVMAAVHVTENDHAGEKTDNDKASSTALQEESFQTQDTIISNARQMGSSHTNNNKGEISSTFAFQTLDPIMPTIKNYMTMPPFSPLPHCCPREQHLTSFGLQSLLF
ncbi:hypothetical protein L2E82_45049 [Cichorium intybus]|uniref:Uncharacterized protein n=1 Tax=Cichorium intybus TaxID=13427 RepID=A0ACB8ZSW5_CICIN|nr:hypothetical protein L2E82_45049 [Cichorium intybus]